ncbi:hypothetical protein V8B97DRAFT_841033 [Scleroderma yunnanense]
MDHQSQGPVRTGGSSTGLTMSHRGSRTPLSHARSSPSKSTLKPQGVSFREPPDETTGFDPGLLTPPSSQILDGNDEFTSDKSSKSSHRTSSKSISRSYATKPHPSTPTRQSTPKIVKRKRMTSSASDVRSPSPKKVPSTCTCGSPAKRILYKSFHANNVNADYVPPSECPSRKCRMRSRSITPAYEPPRERFTPPREIEIINPPFETPRRYKSGRQRVSTQLKSSHMKSEPPEVDLSQALRPPSPSEDPLLLSDSRPIQSSQFRCRFTPAFSLSPSDDFESRDQATSFAVRLSGGRVDDFGDVSATDFLPVFSIPDEPKQMVDDGWSDSDDDFNLTGEYTGKYKMVLVPTKVDPPTSGTKGKMEAWGRPVSPFPYHEILERSFPSSDLTEEDIFVDVDKHEAAPTEECQDTKSIPTPAVVEPCSLRAASARPNHVPEQPSDDDDDEDVDVDIVKVTSGDATTAARAAAILKLHDYDCLLASPSFSKRNRRKTLGNAGIIKPYADSKQRRRTIHGFDVGDPSEDTSLLGIWHSIEDSLLAETNDREKTGEWTRKDWKHLDKCLVVERLAVGASHHQPTELLAPFDRISKDAVLDRFTAEVGGDDVLHSFGSEWSRKNLMLRLEILIRRQQRPSPGRPSECRNKADVATTPASCGTALRYQTLLQKARDVSPFTLAVNDNAPTVQTIDPASGNSHRPVPLSVSALDTSNGRAPITVPSRPPESKLPLPKERVHLRHASLPKKSMIPVPVRPRRLVDLKHWSPSKNSQAAVKPFLELRRKSSVKDLIQCFEGLDKSNRDGPTN